jgi:hypothetical protein
MRLLILLPLLVGHFEVSDGFLESLKEFIRGLGLRVDDKTLDKLELNSGRYSARTTY